MERHDQETLLALRDSQKDWLRAQPGVVRTSIALGRGGDPVIKIYHSKDMNDQVRRAIVARFAGAPVEFDEWDQNEVIRPQGPAPGS